MTTGPEPVVSLREQAARSVTHPLTRTPRVHGEHDRQCRLLGFGVAGAGGLPVIALCISLAAFVLGAVAGGLLVKTSLALALVAAAGLAAVVALAYVPVALGSHTR